jgi:hypothetical protein
MDNNELFDNCFPAFGVALAAHAGWWVLIYRPVTFWIQ